MGESAGGGRGGTKAALNKNKYGRNGKGSRNPGRGVRKHGGESGDSVVRDEEKIDWRMLSLGLVEEIQKKKKPVVLFFLEEEMEPVDALLEIHDETLKKMGMEGEAFFLLVEHNGDRTPSMATDSPIPTSKLTDTNPARAYNIRAYPAIIVCDWNGNETWREDGDVTDPETLKRRIDDVSSHLEALEKKLRQNLDKAKEELADDDLRNFFKALNKNFREGLVGLDAQTESIRMYREVIDKALDEVDEILEERPKNGLSRLKKMSKDFRDTEIRGQIDDAMDIIKG